MKITKEEISQTAVQLFLDKGYNNVTNYISPNQLYINTSIIKKSLF